MRNHEDNKYKLHELYMDVVTAEAADALYIAAVSTATA